MQKKFEKYRNFLGRYMLYADVALESDELSGSAREYMKGRSDAFLMALSEFNRIFDKEINKDE